MRGLILRLLLLTALIFGAGLTAQLWRAPATAAQTEMVGPPAPDPPEVRLQRWEDADRTRREEIAGSESVSSEQALDWRQKLDQQRAEARALADRARAALTPLQAQLDALGPAPDEAAGQTEDAAVAARRLELREQATAQEALLRRAELAVTRADSLIAQISERQREQFNNRVLTRGSSPTNPEVWLSGGREIVSTLHGYAADVMAAALSAETRERLAAAAPLLLAALVGGIFFGVSFKRRALRGLHRLMAESGRSRFMRLILALAAALVRLAAPIFAAVLAFWALMESRILGEAGVAVAAAATAAVMILAGAHALSKAVFAPTNSAARLMEMTDASARAATAASIGLGLAAALDLVAQGVAEAGGLGVNARAIWDLFYVFFASAFFARLAKATAAPPTAAPAPDPNAPPPEPGSEEEEAQQAASGFGLRDALRIACYLAAVAAPILALAGYYVLARYVLTRMAGSAALIAVGMLIYHIALEGAARLTSSGTSGGSAAEERAPWWASLSVGLILFLGLGSLLALIWGASAQDLWDWVKRLRDGFSIGETRISLGDLLSGVLVFAVVLGISRFLQRQLRNRILVRAKVDPGLRDSVTAGVGYLGVLIALLVAVGAAGLDLSKLAIVAGALSVGVGFGLQNVVNNFVSGIILLIERPVRAGDVVEVENRLGAVKRINVRSTEIELFDRTILIVPNSTLISNSVLNWTRQNTILRLSVPVGVVAGSDTERVRDVLLSAARSHARVMRYPAPQAIFMGFSPLSLDFELRVFLYHIDDMMNVRSDLCFAIDKRFRELGIQLPSGREERKMVQMDSLVRGVEAMGRPPAPPEPPPAAAPAASAS
ncbi:DUF3772 domain-containing protein [Neomegalonema perideroedes]|uniref:DUF3772 domain-containing protein n=1 Tax=Neomegalonema perideroedes TaxID=217219 RepID=UPI0003825FCA|nr:DUF3772 domain-containing protein [Neomegalonema perideroedes]